MILLDTAGLLAVLDPHEPRHELASRHFRGFAPMLCTNYIIAEFVALTNRRRVSRLRVLDFLDAIAISPDITMVFVDELLHAQALALLRARPDKSYSLCDAVSFALMDAKRLSEALTTDHHFEQEGYRALLREEAPT